jgi:predicted RNase H-like HicB family nuclease
MSTFDPHRYTITIKLVTLEEGEHFEAVVAELPDLVEYGETYDRAYSLAVESIASLREAAQEQGREFPAPMPSRAMVEFSGRVTLRMSTSLHACASRFADREGVSLNSWIVEAIAARVGGGVGASASASMNVYSAEKIHAFLPSHWGGVIVQSGAWMTLNRDTQANTQFIEFKESLGQLASSNQPVAVGKLLPLQ